MKVRIQLILLGFYFLLLILFYQFFFKFFFLLIFIVSCLFINFFILVFIFICESNCSWDAGNVKVKHKNLGLYLGRFFEQSKKQSIVFLTLVNVDVFNFDYVSIFFDLFFFKFLFSTLLFSSLIYLIFIIWLFFYNFVIFYSVFIVPFSFFFSFFLIIIFFFFLIIIFFFSCIFFFINFFILFRFFDFFFFSKNSVALENEDLWVYCNLFYFDHRISESKELSFSENINDIEVFSTILSIFFKFPYYLFNNDYLLFSKTLQHVILGNNTNLYNSNQDLVEPYNKPELRLDQQENFKFVGFPYIFKKPDFFFVRKLLKSLFIFKGKRKGSFIKRRRMYHKLFKRRNFNFNSDSFSNFKFFHGLNGKLYKQSNISKISSFFKLQNYESPIINKFSFKYNLLSGKSRMESRFLRFFWFSFPFYFLAIQRFFYNFFPVYNPKNCSFFISKVIILSVNFFKSFISAFLNFFFSFTISNVTKMDVLGDLRRIKGSSKIKQIFKSKDQKKRTGKKKELNKKIYENTKFFLRRSQYKRILYSKNSRYFLRKIDYLENDYDFFFAKKRVFSKRFVRKKNIKLRLLWMNRSRFIFPNVYNNTKSINSHIGPTDLFNLLEYFYFVLGADRDLFDNAVYSLIVSTLREKYGDIIVRDLLSREDHKQARSVSVILHVNERENEILNTTSSNLDFFADNNIFDSGELKPNLKLDFELSKISGKSLLVLSPYMSRYLNHLLRYFKVFCNVKNK